MTLHKAIEAARVNLSKAHMLLLDMQRKAKYPFSVTDYVADSLLFLSATPMSEDEIYKMLGDRNLEIHPECIRALRDAGVLYVDDIPRNTSECNCGTCWECTK